MKPAHKENSDSKDKSNSFLDKFKHKHSVISK